MKPSPGPDTPAVAGDTADPRGADHIVSQAFERFQRPSAGDQSHRFLPYRSADGEEMVMRGLSIMQITASLDENATTAEPPKLEPGSHSGSQASRLSLGPPSLPE